MKTVTSQINGKTVQLTPDVEINEELIGAETVAGLKAFRKKNPTADLSIYKVKVKDTNEQSDCD